MPENGLCRPRSSRDGVTGVGRVRQTGPGLRMRKLGPARASTAVILLSACLSGCVQEGRSSLEIYGLSILWLGLTAFILRAANRLTLDAAGPSEGGRTGPILCFTGLFTCVLGAKLNLINSFGAEVPFWDEWDGLAPVFSAFLSGALDPFSLLAPHNEHRVFFTRLICLDLLDLGGQWDPLVQMAVNAFIHSMILTCFCLALWRLAGRKHLAQFCLMIAIIGVLPLAWENTLMGFNSNFYLLLGYSILSMLLLVGSAVFSIPWFLGAAAALCAQLSLGSGFLAPAAASCVLALDSLIEPRRLKKHLPAIAFLILLCILGFSLVRHVPGSEVLRPKGVVNFLQSFLECASWPFWNWMLAPIPWAPFFIFAWRQVRTRKAGGTFERFLLVLGTWTLLMAAAMAYARGGLASRYIDFMFMGPLVNIAALIYLLDPVVGRTWRLLGVTAGVAGLIVSVGVVGLEWKMSTTMRERGEYAVIQEANLGRYVLSGDTSSILNKPLMHIGHPDAQTLIKELRDPRLREVLPSAIRPPLRLGPAEGSGFAPGSVPPGLPGLPHRIVVGSWREEGPKAAAFVSQPVVSRHSRLVFDVAGGGAGTSLELAPASGGPVVRVPVEEEARGWRRVTVAAPQGNFTVRAADESRSGWLAFTWPRELAGAGFFVRQILAGGWAIMLLGLGVLLAGAVISFKDEELERAGR
ncbi:MAG: hypothetical protein WAW37_10315 [Syntrophobacteraceae bacterium]